MHALPAARHRYCSARAPAGQLPSPECSAHCTVQWERQQRGDAEARAAAERARNSAEAEARQAKEAENQALLALTAEQSAREAAEAAAEELAHDK